MNGPTFDLARPWALVLLLGLPLAIAAFRLERRRAPRLHHPRAATLAAVGRGLAGRLAWLPQALLVAALGLVVLGLARPRSHERTPEALAVEGIDIVVALDMSSSMLAVDFKPQNRFHVAKEVLKQFVGRRPNDRIGLVVFSGEAYTQCPLTLDANILRQLVDQLRIGTIENGTAIGNALATSVNRLRESDAKSKVIILITDGDNNAGQVAPMEAAEIARGYGIRVFTILVGKGGVVPVPVGDVPGVYEDQELPVNPKLLQEIARTTGGTYAVATDQDSLEHGLQAVLDRMEKTRMFEASGGSHATELFPEALEPAFWLAALALALSATRFRPFP
ncbi:MAG: VWA domain-containing protein [Anaeromyxobacteraceae bacterium]